MERLGRAFFSGDAPRVARRLLGCRLVSVAGGNRVSGIVVEVEAYKGSRDPASHAYSGMTTRNRVMFEGPGHAYVYFTMGMHWCFNVTTEKVGSAGAVLIRAVEPSEGLDSMLARRRRADIEGLTDGPAKLTEAFGIDGRLNREDLATSRRLFFEKGRRVNSISSTSRVGIGKGREFKWRFFDNESAFVSKTKPATAAQNP